MSTHKAFSIVFFMYEFIAVFLAKLIRVPRTSQDKFNNDWKPVWEVVKRYVGYLFSPNKGLLEKFLNDINQLKPTPYDIKNKYLPIVYIDKPDDLQIILNNSNSLEKSDHVFKLAQEVLGNSIGLARVPRWRRQRHLISPIFNTDMENFCKIFNDKNRQLVRNLEKFADTGQVIDLWDSLSLLSFDTILETMMGFKADDVFTLENKKLFLDNVKRLTTVYAYRTLHLWLHPNLIFKMFALVNGWTRIQRQLIRIASKVIRHRQRILLKQQTHKSKEDDDISVHLTNEEDVLFLARLLKTFQSGSKVYTGRELTQEVLFMLMAGIEPTCLSSCFALLMLAMHPQIQEEVFREIVGVLGDDTERFVTTEDVEKMHLLDRCIKETLRLYPVAPLLARNTTADINLSDGHLLKKCTTVVMSPYCVHRKRELYENPLIWDPDHFVRENVEKRHAYGFIPFSNGPRGCPGARFAMLSMKITLAMIVRQYQLSTEMKMNDIKLKFDLILRSVAGWKVELRRRDYTD